MPSRDAVAIKVCKGTRAYANEAGDLLLSDGEYGFKPDDGWYVRPPGCHMGSIREHTVTEHDDGTITVSPSILLMERDHSWHGYLEKGIWRIL